MFEGLLARRFASLWFFHSPLKRVMAKFLLGEVPLESFLWWLKGLFDCFRTRNPRLFENESLAFPLGMSNKIFLFDNRCYLIPNWMESLKFSLATFKSS